MRFLTYNYVQPGGFRSELAGGVGIYQVNLMRALLGAGHEVTCLSAGDRYDLLRREPRLELRDGVLEGQRFQRAVIWNSPVYAPARDNFNRIASYAEDPGLDQLPAILRERIGPLDALHFQNIEGLTAGFFRALRAAYSDATILLSAHNYNLVCPVVNLWFRNHQHCVDYRQGNSCVNCLPSGGPLRNERELRQTETLLQKLGLYPSRPAMRMLTWARRTPSRALRSAKAAAMQVHRLVAANAPESPIAQALVLTEPEKAAAYRRYRETNVELVHEGVFDRVLAVSSRTASILANRGVPKERIAVSYIGTAHKACSVAQRVTTPRETGHVHVGFLGYMRADKGFYTFLDALEALQLDPALAVSVTVAAPVTDQDVMERLRQIACRFRTIRIFDGYSHATLDQVLAGVELGVVPPIWEDSLPQVAFEFVAHGIPILTSDRGGAQEIASNPLFVFPAGESQVLAKRICDAAAGRLNLGSFWDQQPRMRTMEEHVTELLGHYALRRRATRAAEGSTGVGSSTN